jgi:SAM-dependent methyltransferase
MTQLLDDLAFITAKTLEHYNERAAEFWEGTRDHDVTQNIEALLRHIRGAPPLRILDFGCGPGRDLAAFRSLGHEPTGLEGSPPLAAMAREHTGCEVWEQDFLALTLPAGHFECLAVPRATPRAASRVKRTTRSAQAGGRALYLEPSRE